MSRHLDDDELLALLSRALRRTEQPPPHLREAALVAHTWHSVDAELAQLVYDSVVPEAGDELVAVRSDDGPRQITFEAPGVEIEVTVAGSTRTMVGQLVPPQAAQVELTEGDRVVGTTADELGRFRFEDIDPGPVRLTVLGSNHRTVQTEWIVL